MANNIDRQYLELVNHILRFGYDKKDRTGTGTKSIFDWNIRHRMSEGFPLLTTKKVHFKSVVTELLWFLRGDTNIKYLVDNDCHIWDGDAYQNYRKIEFERIMSQKHGEYLMGKEEFINKIKTDDEFAKKWGELGPVYGRQWRSWESYDFYIDNDFGNNAFGGGWDVIHIDQIADAINLLKTDPDSRRNMVNAWNVGELNQMALPPCHYGFQFYTRELSDAERLWMCSQRHHIRFGTNDGPTWHNPDNPDRDKIKWMTEDQRQLCDSKNIPTRAISLKWTQRSVDVGLGLPFNIASYALLLEIVAKEVNMVPEELIGSLGDCHIYNNHIDGLKEQLTRVPYELPKLDIHPGILDYDLDKLEKDMFTIENYQSHPAIKLPLSN